MTALEGIAALLALDRLDDDAFTASTPTDPPGRLFGGQVAAHSMRAACLTVPAGRLPHSLHAYFIRAGRPGEPLRLDVQRSRDGRSFSTRHVTASQNGKPIFEGIASFQDVERGVEWQPDPPSGLLRPRELGTPALPRLLKFLTYFELCPAAADSLEEHRMGHPFWIRSRHPVGDDPLLNACVLTYLSDIGLVGSSRAPGSTVTFRNRGQVASLDHSMWFHRPVRTDEWLLYTARSVANFGARGLAHGSLHTADGVLVASVAQEALLRPAPA